MHPRATTTAVQTGQLARPRGALMNWKESLSTFLIYVGINFPVFYLTNWKDGKLHFDPHYLIKDALAAIALGLLIVGLQELRRGGHQRARRILWKCYFIWIAIFIDLLCVAIAYKATSVELAMDYFLDFSLVLAAVPFPLALYLNRKQNTSTSQPITNNAS
jgi:hypothetical protein